MQHGHLDHGLVWDEQLHAPLIVRAPDLAPRRFPHPVQAIDVLPTLLGLVDLPDEDKILDQVSGADVLAASWTPAAVFSRSSARQTKLGEDLTWSLTTDRWKFHLESDGRHHLYDLRKDPHEHDDIAKQHPQLVADLEAELVASLARQRERAKALGAGKTEKLDAQTVQELKEMGYME
jgi:arylsulfatase A-like enzyme